MKHLPASLLVACLIGCAFVPSLSVAHSLIIISLTVLFGYNQYLIKQEQPDITKELAKVHSDLEEKITKLKESHESEIKELKDEMGKVSLSTIRPNSGVTKSGDRKIVF